MPVTISFDPNSINIQSATIQNATPSSDGVMSKAQAATLAAAPSPAQVTALQSSVASLIATTAVDIYVDAVAGLDTNPGTLAAPLKTFDAAVNLLPAQWEQSCTIHCAAGNYAFDVANYIFGNAIGSQSAPLLIEGVTADQLGNLTTLAGSTSTSYVASVVTTGSLRGASITNLTTGRQARISSSSYNGGTGDTTFTLATALSVTVGDHFVVTKPGTNFLIPTGFTAGMLKTYVNFLNIRFAQQTEASPFAPLIAAANNAIVGFYNCEIDCGSNSRWLDGAPGSRIVCSSQSNAFGNLAVNPVSFTSSGLWLYTDAGGISGHQFFDYAEMLGTLMLDGSVLSLNRLALADLSSLDMNNSALLVSDGSVAGISAINANGSNASQSSTIVVANGGVLDVSAGTIANSLGAAIDVKCARARIGSVGGTGNATFGIVAELGSQVRVVAGTTVTGTTAGNDTEVGTTTKAYAALPFTDLNANSIQVG